MEVINWSQQQDLMRAGLLGVKPVLLFVVTRGRNAWHSTWVRNYQGPASLVGSLRAAKALAEQQRVQGSVFYIREVPGLTLLTEEGPLGLVEFHSDNCFGKWDVDQGAEVLRLGAPIASVLHALGPQGLWNTPVPSRHSFISGSSGWHSLMKLPPRRPLKSWFSQSAGGNYMLNWLEHPSEYSRRGVNRIFRMFEKLNPQEERTDAEAQYWAAGEAAAERDRVASQEAEAELDRAIADLNLTLMEIRSLESD